MDKKLLFLDDVRHPKDAYEYTNFKLFIKQEWNIVRNYNEFVEWITTNGMPDFISFDHDLADSHYTPEHLWCDYAKSKEWQDKQIHTEKTGYECAKWLLEYITDNHPKYELPQYYSHSMNPVGKDKIITLLNNYTTPQWIRNTNY
jgi:hypothetical protein